MKRTRLAYPYIFVWMPLFIVAPMLFVAYYAFFDNGTFTTEYVKQVFQARPIFPRCGTPSGSHWQQPPCAFLRDIRLRIFFRT